MILPGDQTRKTGSSWETKATLQVRSILRSSCGKFHQFSLSIEAKEQPPGAVLRTCPWRSPSLSHTGNPPSRTPATPASISPCRRTSLPCSPCSPKEGRATRETRKFPNLDKALGFPNPRPRGVLLRTYSAAEISRLSINAVQNCARKSRSWKNGAWKVPGDGDRVPMVPS